MRRNLILLHEAALASARAFAARTCTVTLDVTKMDCAACALTVRVALGKVPGVDSVKVDFKAKGVIVVFDPAKTSSEALTTATADAGYPSTVRQEK
ncbi:mercury resistance system periplasmic binding protein MerP [Cupriavidus sp. CV2]|uniref:mercury resistance system periplasmic binding protein MerP n=1 Tax=Cupriavidus ulmosensis TaxID=3065913 RepID=UPI00296AF2A6|nr:mercury resistance system periplasmic binding protein MerP [Cupriavidus sp. CV2]MDW3689021.1 mercury resistance system periplasmic binding protein MerP [Cupriavidus sp. CV2]